MLHDVGKVGIPDAILKKKGKLNEEEFRVMKMHTLFGSRLFYTSESEWEIMASEISLNHHEKWDGTGYPGEISDIYDDNVILGKGKKGCEIPLSARIVALADVYDALISNRVYKDAWEEEKTLYYIKNESGKHFDPELVKIFIEIYDVIKAIRNKWHD
jgi:response regulator RpfG family c-di-GMP phosphodiesterase